MKKVISKNLGRNQNSSNSKLCAFSSLDYIVLASTLAVALGEELSSNDINILATFFAVLSDELALIAAVDVCSSSEEEETFTAPTPDVAVTGFFIMIFKKLLADSALIGCMFKKLLIIAFNSEIFGNFLTNLSSAASIFTTDCDN